MKKLLFIASVLAAGLTACTDKDIVEDSGFKPAQAGEEIQFGATQNPLEFNDLDNPGTRTHYGFYYDDGEENGKYPIYWDNGDKIAIYSPEATVPSSMASQYSSHEMDYKIVIDETKDTNAGTLTKIETNGLQWTDATDYNFYAFYPSSAKQGTVVDEDPETGKNRVGVQLNLPTSQAPVSIDKVDKIQLTNGRTASGYVARPNMDYCYMYAHTTYNKNTGEYHTHTGKPAEGEEATSSTIKLDFKPIVTTAEFIIHGPGGDESIEVSQVVIRSAQAICGDFNLFIGYLGDDNDGHTFPTSDNIVTNQVTIPLYHDVDGEQRGVTLTGDSILIVRAFLLPYETVLPQKVETAVTVHMVGGGTKTKLLESTTGIQKHKINIAELPTLKKSETNFWLSMINEDAYFSQISMPGSHNAYDYNINWKDGYTGSSNENIMNDYQTLDIDQQLAGGARAFSFVVGLGDYDADNGALTNWTSNYDLYTYPGGSQNKNEAGKLSNVLKTFAESLRDLNKSYHRDHYPNSPLKAREFLVLNIGFQQRLNSGTWADQEQYRNHQRNLEISRWLKELDRIIDETAEEIQVDGETEEGFHGFTNDINSKTTIGDLGGQIVIFVTVQTPSWPQSSDYYFTNNSVIPTRDFDYNPTSDAKYYVAMCPTEDVSGTDITSAHAAKNDRDYDYAYVMSPYGNGTGSGIKVWRQQLERLSYAGTTTDTNLTQYSKRTATKKTLVKDLFDEAINNNKDGNAIGNWYINNLGGFTVVNDRNSYSTDLGWGGNTVMAASEINKYAYEYLANTANNVAPCGVVLLNFYGVDKLTGVNGDVNIYGKTLPQVIIENNYRFALKTRTSSTDNSGSNSGTTTQSDSKYSSGGNAISWSY